MNLYMTEITLPAYLSHELIELIPAQRAHIDKLLQENVCLLYTSCTEIGGSFGGRKNRYK